MEASNIATTTRSPGSLPTPPSPRRILIDVDSPPTDEFNQPIAPRTVERAMEVTMSPLAMLGADMKFSRGVKVALPGPSQEVIRVVPPADLLKGGVEMLYRVLVMV